MSSPPQVRSSCQAQHVRRIKPCMFLGADATITTPLHFTMRTSFVWAGLTFAALAAAAPSRRFDLKVKEAVAPPREWSRVAVAPPDLTIDLRIALPQSNFAALEQHLYEIR